MEGIFFPDWDGTNSLLMKRPSGWVYLRPFGAVRSVKRSDILDQSSRHATAAATLDSMYTRLKRLKVAGAMVGLAVRKRRARIDLPEGCRQASGRSLVAAPRSLSLAEAFRPQSRLSRHSNTRRIRMHPVSHVPAPLSSAAPRHILPSNAVNAFQARLNVDSKAVGSP